jgi:hypothetical protein
VPPQIALRTAHARAPEPKTIALTLPENRKLRSFGMVIAGVIAGDGHGTGM